MVLRMKNFNIFGVHWKIQLLRGGSQKTNTEERDYLKRGAWTVADLRGAWQERGGGAFEGVEGGAETPMHTMSFLYLLQQTSYQSLAVTSRMSDISHR